MLTESGSITRGPGTQGAGRPELGPLSVVRMVWKHKLQLTLVWLLGSVAAVAVVYSLPAIYKSEAVILVRSQRIPEQYVTTTVNTELQDRLATLKQEILSRDRLKAVIEELDLYRNERKNHSLEEVVE